MRFAESSAPPPAMPSASADGAMLPGLDTVVARMAAEVAMPLTHALERVLALASSGRIDRPGLAALRDEIDDARRVGLRGQQIVRFASGQVRPSAERLDLAGLLHRVLTDAAGAAAGTAPVRWQPLAAAEVVGDASLVHAMLQAASDWSQALARAGVEWRLEVQPWPVQARVSCRFAPRVADLAPEGGPAATRDDTLDWLLLQYTAHLAGVQVGRATSGDHLVLTLRFPHTVNETLEGASALELGARDGASLLSGSQVLVLAARRDARQQVRAAMHGHDLFVDYVPSVAEALRYCEEGLPQVLIYESSFDGEPLRALCAMLGAQSPGVALIELVPGRQGCEVGGQTSLTAARVGSEGLRQTLASVMVLELARRR